MKNKKGFTLVELVIVIAVIAILAAVLIPTFAGIIDRARNSTSKQTATNARSEFLSSECVSPSDMVDYVIVVNENNSDHYFKVVDENGTIKEVNENDVNILKDYDLVQDSNTSNAIIYMPTTTPRYYVTFYDSDETTILQQTLVNEGAKATFNGTLPSKVENGENISYYYFNYWAEYGTSTNAQTAMNSVVNDMSLVPVFKDPVTIKVKNNETTKYVIVSGLKDDVTTYANSNPTMLVRFECDTIEEANNISSLWINSADTSLNNKYYDVKLATSDPVNFTDINAPVAENKKADDLGFKIGEESSISQVYFSYNITSAPSTTFTLLEDVYFDDVNNKYYGYANVKIGNNTSVWFSGSASYKWCYIRLAISSYITDISLDTFVHELREYDTELSFDSETHIVKVKDNQEDLIEGVRVYIKYECDTMEEVEKITTTTGFMNGFENRSNQTMDFYYNYSKRFSQLSAEVKTNTLTNDLSFKLGEEHSAQAVYFTYPAPKLSDFVSTTNATFDEQTQKYVGYGYFDVAWPDQYKTSYYMQYYYFSIRLRLDSHITNASITPLD